MILNYYFTQKELDKLVKLDDVLLKCETLVWKLFQDKTDKAGKPYIGHLYRVSERLFDYKEKCAGLLHDTLEDIEGMTVEDLRYIGIPEDIIEIVVLVTKQKGLTYDEEITKIISSGNAHAMRLKKADMQDNMDKVRMSMLEEHVQKRLKAKYGPQIKRLMNAVD